MSQKTLNYFNPVPTSCKKCSVMGCPRKNPQQGCQADMIHPKKWCGTCSMHKKGKTFEEDCPRLHELMFKGGHRSALDLMKETFDTSQKYEYGCPSHQYRNPVIKAYLFELPGKKLQPKLKKKVAA